MLSIHYNSRVKSWRNKKRSAKNNKIKPFIDKYNWEGINFLAEKDDSKKIEKNNWTIVFNVLFAKKEKLYPAYASKHKSNREKCESFNDS